VQNVDGSRDGEVRALPPRAHTDRHKRVEVRRIAWRLEERG
jgi:hypothetical protein